MAGDLPFVVTYTLRDAEARDSVCENAAYLPGIKCPVRCLCIYSLRGFLTTARHSLPPVRERRQGGSGVFFNFFKR